jgi:hypothetical protein
VIQFEEDRELMRSLRGVQTPSKRYQGKFYVYTEAAGIGGHSQRYLLDSGTQYPVLFERPAQEFTVLRNEPAPMMVMSTGDRKLRPCIVHLLRFGNVVLQNVQLMLADPLPGEQPFEDGLLPLNLFESIYFNNEKGYVILNPIFRRNE